MRILVTGATGKVGNAVARRLSERGDDVVALVRDPARARELLPREVALAPGDVTDAASLESAAEGCDAAINAMGLFEQWFPDPAIFDRVNADGARNVVAACRRAGARRVVHTSTFDVFAAEPGGTVSEQRLDPRPKGTHYERSKQRAEELVLAEADLGIEVVIANPAGVYGPGPWAGTGLDRMFADAIRGRLPAVPPGGMTLAYVGDVADGHIAALDSGTPGQRYILADGYATMAELCAVAVEAAGRGRVPRTLPLPAARALAATGEVAARLLRRPPLLGAGQLHFLQWQVRADHSKAAAELGFEPIDWRDGVERTVAWILAAGRA